MSFGGAGPGMAILTGFAEAEVANDKRKREIQQDAIRNRLMEEQVENARQNLYLQETRERRFSEEAIANRERMEQEREAAELAEVEQQAQRQLSIDQVAGMIMRDHEGMDPNEALQLASLHVNKVMPYKPPEPPKPVDPNASLLRYQHDLETEARVQRIISNPEHRQAIVSARDLNEALSVADNLGLDHAAVSTAFGQLHDNVERYENLYQMPSHMRTAVIEDAGMKSEQLINEAIRIKAEGSGGETESSLGDAELALALFRDELEVLDGLQGKGQPLTDMEMFTNQEIEKELENRVSRERARRARTHSQGQGLFGWIGSKLGGNPRNDMPVAVQELLRGG